jgi:hypothetical protein
MWDDDPGQLVWADAGAGGGATTALDNLASVAINTSLILDTSDSAALGSVTKMWSDLFLADGGVINFNNGNAIITHSAGALTFSVFPVTPSSAPTTDYQVANKKYVDDNGGAVGKWTVETKTDNYNVLTTDVAKTLVMNSASDKTFSLPSVSSGDVGTWYIFVKIGAGKVTIDAADSDTIGDSGAGDTIYNNYSTETYATITLELISETKWAIIGLDGTWITTD